MRTLTCCLLLLFPGTVLHAQSAEDSVKSRVTGLFDAMRKGDSTLISAQFADGGELQSVDERGGKVKVTSTPVPRFAHIIATLPVGSADERPSLDMVRVDGNLAVVWAPYQFFYKGSLHHCGIDSFQLVRLDGVWKIQYIIDTEHGCK